MYVIIISENVYERIQVNVKNTAFILLALYFECRINKNAFLQTAFLAIIIFNSKRMF